MRSIVWLLIVTGLCISSLGCGGTSESDMMRRAVKGNPDEEEDTGESVPPSLPTESGEQQEGGSDASSSPPNVPAQDASSGAPPEPIATSSNEEPAPAETASNEAPPTEIARPQTVEQRRQWTIDNLTKIGKAIEAYRQDKGGYPPAAITIQREALLSWRVQLLPYLGYKTLYEQFHRDESWDSIHNKSLLSKIPVEYQSAERFDEKTNYLGCVGSNLAFEPVHGRVPNDFEDGLINTVFVMEVDDSLAVPWTQPKDYPYQPDQMPLGLGELREDGFFVVWGGGAVGRIAGDTAKMRLIAMLTIDTGDAFRYTQIHHEATAKPILQETEVEAGSKVEADVAASQNPETKTTPADPKFVVIGQEDEKPIGTITPPTLEEQKVALQTLRQLYEKKYKEARTKEKRRELAQEIFNHLEKLEEDLASRFVLLELTILLAAAAGDLQTALNAAELLAGQFTVNEFDYRVEAIRLAVTSKAADSDLLMNTAIDALRDAINLDDYKLAREMYGIAYSEDRESSSHSKQRNPKLIVEKRRMEAGEKGFHSVSRALKKIETAPNDPASNRAIGEYYCLIKDQWERGLPFLAKGDNEQLAYLAGRELQAPGNSKDYVEVADGWWDYGETHSPQKRSCQLRAVYWYLKALAQGRSGLPALKAEVRLREAETRYSREVIDELKNG